MGAGSVYIELAVWAAGECDMYYTGNPFMAVITALMIEINPVWTKRLDGIDFVSSFKGDTRLLNLNT